MSREVSPETQSPQPSRLDAALAFARAGWAVFPIWHVRADRSCACGKPERGQIGKHPRCWHGHNDATTDEAQIRRWWAAPQSGDPNRWQCDAESNVGIAVPDGVVIVDIDPRNGGLETLAKIDAEHGAAWQESPTVASGGGGFQVYLSCEPGQRFPQNLDNHFGPGIDLKQRGGYVLAPPSNHKSGGVYEWINDLDTPIAPAPPWLAALSMAQEERPVAAAPPPNTPISDELRERLDRAIEVIAPHYVEGVRHFLALYFGGYMRNLRQPESAAVYVVSQLPSSDHAGRVRDARFFYQPNSDGSERTPKGADGFRDLGLDDLLAELDALELDERPGAKYLRGKRPSASEAPAFDGPYFLRSERDAEHILLWRSPELGYLPVAVGSARMVIKRYGLDGAIELYETKGRETKPIPVQALIERHGMTFVHGVYDFALARTEYDPTGCGSVRVGYQMAPIEPKHDVDVDKWLHALGGEQYSRLAQWIAACAQRHIHRLTAALTIIGPKDVGKTLIAHASHGLWGEGAPPTAGLLVAERFNGDLTRSPVVFDDEALLMGSKKLSTKRFRELIQGTERPIELKGRECFQLRGALRMVIAANGAEDLKFTDVTGSDVVDAVADRLLVIDAKPRTAECRAALARLRLPGGWVCDLPRIAAHLAWLTATVEIIDERFVGASGGADAVLVAHVAHEPAMWATLWEWIDSPGVKRASGWSVHDGELCVDPEGLTQSMDGIHGWDRARVERALGPLRKEGMKRPGAQGAVHRPRLWLLHAEHLARVAPHPDTAAALRRLVQDSVQPRDARSGQYGPTATPSGPPAGREEPAATG